MDERHASLGIEGVSKTFRIPRHHVMTLKERALHPLRRVPVSELHALRDVSFSVRDGEFFGIVGRNGSGKSTLLKCMAGIYATDRGRISVAGRVVPFIELGVGFNMEMTALDNVVINGVMMGLSPREARRRFDEVIAFAELQDFVDLKLKNYSSGMQVRLAFALMVQADADILLIDEVLAVGDAGFQRKCMDEFYALREAGRTIVLVTHDMAMVQRFAHRALLLDEGRVDCVGEPESVARRYLELNFARAGAGAGPGASESGDRPGASIEEVWVEDLAGRRVDALGQDEPMAICATIAVHRPIADPEIGVTIHDEEGIVAFGTTSRRLGRREDPLAAGELVRLRIGMQNRLRPGRWFIDCGMHAGPAEVVAFRWRARDFIVHGTGAQSGLVSIDHSFDLERERSPAGVRP
jgi:ABC-type polysaccharide/polyol phosphate transport system ATPase subunit